MTIFESSSIVRTQQSRDSVALLTTMDSPGFHEAHVFKFLTEESVCFAVYLLFSLSFSFVFCFCFTDLYYLMLLKATKFYDGIQHLLDRKDVTPLSGAPKPRVAFAEDSEDAHDADTKHYVVFYNLGVCDGMLAMYTLCLYDTDMALCPFFAASLLSSENIVKMISNLKSAPHGELQASEQGLVMENHLNTQMVCLYLDLYFYLYSLLSIHLNIYICS